MYRIGFTGAHGTGKTSLAKYMVENIPGYVMVPSTARKAKAAGYKINREADELSQLMTMLARIVEEDKIADNNAVAIVSDRTSIDSLAYTKYQMDYVWKETNPYYWEVCKDIARRHMEKYDIVFYFPVFWPPIADGDRDPDPEYQEIHDKYILELLKEFKIPFEVMVEGSVADRFDHFLERS